MNDVLEFAQQEVARLQKQVLTTGDTVALSKYIDMLGVVNDLKDACTAVNVAAFKKIVEIMHPKGEAGVVACANTDAAASVEEELQAETPSPYR